MMRKTLAVLVSMLLASSTVFADGFGHRKYAVTITNITSGQTFTPLLVVTHKSSVSLFEPGEPASAELATLAESGDVSALASVLDGMPSEVFSTADSGGLLGPGESVTVEIRGSFRFRRISVAGMLIPTNDTFVALNAAHLPIRGHSYTVPAYDAGSEFNDELCSNIPGPTCGGAGNSVEDGEGYVHISRGISGIGDLEPSNYDWRNPVARISIERIR
jgi:hypothetical protein